MRASPRWLVRTGLAAVLAAGGVLGAASPAFATDCAGLQAALDAAQVGDTVTIDEGSVCVGPFTLPARAIAVAGAGSGATIDGGNTTPGLVGGDVGSTAISNLTFRAGRSATSGGGLAINGDATPVIGHSRFFGNSSDAPGGGLSVITSATEGTVTLTNNVFGDGSASAANSASSGGGAYIA